MRRREFIALLGSAAVWPLAGHAQQPNRRVGVLMSSAEDHPDGRRRKAALLEGLRSHGWTDGQNLAIEYRWASGDIEEMNRFAVELVGTKPEVIVANATPVVAALKRLTATIPIVCSLVIDPVGNGFAASLSRPGGNITGFTFIDAELIGKWMDLLKQAAPRIDRAALIFNPKTTPFYDEFVGAIKASRPSIDLVTIRVSTASELELGIGAEMRAPGGSLIMGPDPFTFAHGRTIAQLTKELRVPAISVHRQFVSEGGLMSYGPDTAAVFRQSASYVDRILRGAKPGELPIQRPTKYELAINLATAKALDLAIPPTLLALADEVIE